MAKILLVSDSHSLKNPLRQIFEEHSDATCAIHCGDSELTRSELQKLGNFQSVKGNCDFEDFDRSLDLQVQGYKIHIEHGDRFSNLQSMLYYAMELGCDIFVSGHTHIPHEFHHEGIVFLNPGSLKQNRDGSDPSYMILHLEEEVSAKKLRLSDL